MRKIYDIIPPEKKIIVQEKRIEKPRFFPWKVWLFFFALFVLFSYFIFLKITRVKIFIVPSLTEKTFTSSFFISSQPLFSTSDFIYAHFFEFEQIFSFSFPATGKAKTKAEGVIRLYNQYTTKQEVWKKGTRFISSDGKVFLSKDQIVVPPAILEGGKLKASFVDVPVEAQEAGENYNIGPSKFAIIAFSGTDRYDKYWGQSLVPMTGGGEKTIVTNEDLKGAQQTAREKIKEKIVPFLKEKLGSDYYFIEDAYEVEILDESSSARVQDSATSFDYFLRLKIRTISPKLTDLEEFSQRVFEEKIDKEELYLKRSLSFVLRLKEKDFEKEQLKGEIEIKALTYPRLDGEKIKTVLVGQEIKKLYAIVGRYYPFKEIKIKTVPFFLIHFPEREKIDIFLTVD